MTVVPSTVETLSDYALQVLSVCESALATTDAGAPADAYVDAGPPAYDCCPALIVYVNGLTEAVTRPLAPPEATARRIDYGSIILSTYVIQALRCAAVPDVNGNPPTAARKTEVAIEVQQDGWAIWNAVDDAVRNGDLFDRCTGIHMDGWRPITAQGGCVGGQLIIRAMIPGIPNDSS